MNELDYDGALPPALRRSPRAALEAQKLSNQSQYDYDDSDDEYDEATPPPIARSRSNSFGSLQSEQSRPRTASSADLNPLRAHPVDAAAAAPPVPHLKFSYPFRAPDPAPLIPTRSRRRPRGLISYKTNKKIPMHLRRQPSLETIASVATIDSITPSEDLHDPPEAEAPSPEYFAFEDDPTGTLALSSELSNASSTHSSHGSLRELAATVSTPLEYASLGHHSPQSLFRKLMPRRPDDPSPTPTRLVIERTISFDRTSTHSGADKSSTSITRASPDRATNSELFNVERSQSGSSSEWSASSFDVSILTEAELKKCKKKGINPALYAEMRAARKGKWASPIAGNTFL